MDIDLVQKLIAERRFVVGNKQVLRAHMDGSLDVAILADDADTAYKTSILEASSAAGIRVLLFPSKQGLGELCNIEVAAASVGVLKAKKTDK